MTNSPMSPEKRDSGWDPLELSALEEFRAVRLAEILDKLQRAYSEERHSRKLLRAEIARSMGVDRAQITRILGGRQNITLRTLVDLVHSMGRDIELEFPVRDQSAAGQNHFGSVVTEAFEGGLKPMQTRAVMPETLVSAENAPAYAAIPEKLLSKGSFV